MHEARADALPQLNASNITNGHILYVDELAHCTQQLVASYCGSGSCTGYDPGGGDDVIAQCTMALANFTPRVDPEQDPCNTGSVPNYDTGLHIAGVFIILGASVLGVGLPVLGKYNPSFVVNPFLLCLGKCLGIGILLAIALVHVLLPASEALSSPCLSRAFTENYGSAYAFMFALLAIFLMQFVDFAVEAFLISRLEESGGHTHAHSHGGASQSTLKSDEPMQQKRTPEEQVVCVHLHVGVSNGGNSADSKSDAIGKVRSTSVEMKELPASVHSNHLGREGDGLQEGHSHAHSILLMKNVKRTITTYLLEFGVAVHSVLIGLTIGVVGASAFKTLLVALAFHQCFEGVALGSRIVEAELRSRLEEFLLVFIFSISTPVGMAIGIGITSSINPNGATYNYTAGILDAICAGILLYIGLLLLLNDFPADMKKHCSRQTGRSNTNIILRKFGMFLALWVGGGVLAYIGRYL